MPTLALTLDPAIVSRQWKALSGNASPASGYIGTYNGTGTLNQIAADADLEIGVAFKAGNPGGSLPVGAIITAIRYTGNWARTVDFVTASSLYLFYFHASIGGFPTVSMAGASGTIDVTESGLLIARDDFVTNITASPSISGSILPNVTPFGFFFGPGDIGAGTISFTVSSLAITITYTFADAWYYNPVTDHYAFGQDPGAPWRAQQADISMNPHGTGVLLYRTGNHPSVAPASGSTAGGKRITIKGRGFGDGAVVTIGGTTISSDDTTVVDSKTITILTPPHTPGLKTVTIQNGDGSEGSSEGAFLYYTPAQWLLHRCDVKPRTEETQ